MIIGDTYLTKNYGTLTVVEYINSKTVRVMFVDGTITTAEAQAVRSGRVKNPYHPRVCNIGYIGRGRFSMKTHPVLYTVWKSMITRCYSSTYQSIGYTYIGCTVDERWHNFQQFAVDYEHMIGCEKPSWCLDKDLLYMHNKVYSNENCVLVPPVINQSIKEKITKNSILPTGVYLCKSVGSAPYYAQCTVDGKVTHLGSFQTVEAASSAYRKSKSRELMRVADLYKTELDQRAYEALIQRSLLY